MNENQKSNAGRTAALVVTSDLLGMKHGDPIERYSYFRNLTFVERSNGHVTMRDKFGNERRVYESLFLKYARLPNIRHEPRPTE